MNGSRSSTGRSGSREKGSRFLRPLLLLGGVCLLAGCGSDVSFRRFEIPGVPPEKVFTTAKQVVKDFYTRYHGGVVMDVDEEQRSLVMGPLQKKPAGPGAGETARVATYYVEPIRQTLYLRVLPGGGGSVIEMLAVIERLAVEDPDEVSSPDDVWRFLRQDRQVEDRLFDEIAKRLTEEGVLQ